jgi:hypothetical protein
MREHVQKKARPQQGEFLYPGRLAGHTNGRRAVRSSPHANVEGRGTNSVAPGSNRFAHDFSRVPVHSKPSTDSPAILEAARLGVSGAKGALPYLDVLQKSFGRHDLSGIASHTDAHAAAGARMMGASAFTTGRHVAFVGQPSLHTAAHEAAHAIQQRGGVQLKGGVGEAADRYERHADEVANRVVAGRSSEGLLDAYAPRARAANSVTGGVSATQMKTDSGVGDSVQMKSIPTAYGTFEDVYYDKITNAKDEEIGCEMYVRFTPNDKVDATMIGLTQTVKSYKEGASNTVDATKQAQSVTAGPGKDFHIDQYGKSRNPLYVTSDAPAADADKMSAWTAGPKVTAMSEKRQKEEAAGGKKGVKYDGLGQHGYRKKSGAAWVSQPAEMDDWPILPDTVGKKDSGQTFETTALAIEGTQQNMYYGSVQWGWQRDDKAAFKLVDFKAVSQGVPSSIFLASAEKWNASKTSGNEATIKLPTVEVYTTNSALDVLSGADKIKLDAKTRVRVISKGGDAKTPWQVEIVDGPYTGKKTSIDGASLTKES